jgi:cytochrome c-type biogenesis protein CcmH/NrfG
LADRAIKSALRRQLQTDPDQSDLYVTHGHALLELNRPAEALESLRKAHEFWQDFNAQSHWAAESAYWYGRALIATGDAKLGQHWVRQMQPRLAKSPLPLHRALVPPAAARG